MGGQRGPNGTQNGTQWSPNAPQFNEKSMIKKMEGFCCFQAIKSRKNAVLGGAGECKNSVFTRKVFKNQGFLFLRKTHTNNIERGGKTTPKNKDFDPKTVPKSMKNQCKT